MKNQSECYLGTISVAFRGLPAINLVSVILKPGANWFQRVSEATRRRFFTLQHDWQIDLNDVNYHPKLNGTITIPKTITNQAGQTEDIVFDGASVPFPWLVSFLSIGILRPLGVMLVASIIHDFAFKYGYLLVSPTENQDAEPKKIPIERHHADALFRDIISTVNQVGMVGWIAWFFVRLGWLLGVKYHGKLYGGKPPYLVVTSFISILVGGGLSVYYFPNYTVTAFVGFYLLFYAATIVTLGMYNVRTNEPSDDKDIKY